MAAFLSDYLEDGRRKNLKESTLHLHDKVGYYFGAAVTSEGRTRPQELNAENIGKVCLRVSSRWYLSYLRTFLRYAYRAGYTARDYICVSHSSKGRSHTDSFTRRENPED